MGSFKTVYVGVNATGYLGEYDSATGVWSSAYELPLGTRIGGLRVARNISRVYGLGQRSPKALVPLRYTAEWNMDSTFTSYALTNILQGWAMGNQSQISNLKGVPLNDILIVFTDGKVYFIDDAFPTSFNIAMGLDNPVQFSIAGGAYKIDQSDTTVYPEPTNASTDNNDIAVFTIGTFTVDNTDLGVVQNVRIDVRMDTNLAYGLGSPLPKAVIPGQISITGSFVLVVSGENIDLVNELASDTYSSKTLKLTIDFSALGTKTLEVDVAYITNIRSAVLPNQQVSYNVAFEGTDFSIV